MLNLISGISRSSIFATPARRAAVYALGLVLAMRLFTSLVLLITGLLLPTSFQPGDPLIASNLKRMEEQNIVSKYFLAPWYRWDSLHFVNIADQGYSNKIETVWPPLYPLVTRAAAAFFPPTLLAALLVSTLAAAAALTLLYLLVQDTWDEKTARSTLLYLAFFPTAFYLVAAYTESLFLALSLGCLYAYKKSHWAAATALGAAAVLTRFQGIVLIAPMAWEVLNDLLHRRPLSPGLLARRIIPGGVIALTLAGYILFVHYGLGADWPWQTQSAIWHQQIVWPWVGLLGNFTGLTIHPIDTLYPPFVRFSDLFLICAALVLLIWTRKKIPTYFLVYAAGMLLVILTKTDSQNQLDASGRYLLAVFPVMVAAALTLNKTARRIWTVYSIGSQAFLIILFYWWIWGA